MQSFNSYQKTNTTLPPQDNRKRTVLIVGVSIFFLVALSYGILHKKSTPPTNPGDAGEYYDPASRETVSNPAGKATESFGDNAQGPNYLGFSKILSTGISDDQLQAVEDSLATFTTQLGQKNPEISVYVDSIASVPFDRDSGANPSVTFDIRVNRKTDYSVSVEYYEITKIKLLVLGKTNKKVLYETGEVDNNAQAQGDEGGD